MPRTLPTVSSPVKRSILVTLTLALTASVFAVDVQPKLDEAIRQALPVCPEATVKYSESPAKLPPRFNGTLVQVEDPSNLCSGHYLAVVSPTGGLFLGSPWTIADEEGSGIPEKLKNFTWRNMGQNVTATVTPKITEDGLLPVTLTQVTEHGGLPLLGLVDPQGHTFFFGPFRRLGTDVLAQRMKAFDPYLAASPARGPATSPVTIVEFSDFQCPACRRTSGYADSIVAKHGEKVRYVRFDLPLSGHPWAFPASLAGRAIHRQKPDLFWEFKKNVYENQDNLTAFMFWDWARAWAEDHDLDLARYDADLQNAELRSQILAGAGLALSNDVRATPTYFVNGAIVVPGEGGQALSAYVDKLLAR